MSVLEELQAQIRQCRHCEEKFGYEPRPVVRGHENAPIMQISQAPGRKVHESGIPFDDASGAKLRHEWYQIRDDQFYDEDLFYITTVGHCYPGKAKSGDKKPPACCYGMWTEKEIGLKRNTKLYLVIGKEAADRIFGKERPFEQLVFEDQQINGVKAFVLPHPSPLNRKWLKDHPEFESERLPQIRQELRKYVHNQQPCQ